MKSFYRLCFYISYSLLLILFIDSRMLKPSIGYYDIYSWFYSALWLFLGIPFLKDVFSRGFKVNKNIGKIYFVFIAYFFVFIVLSLFLSKMESEVTREVLWYIRFLSALLLTIFWINKLKVEKFFIIISSLIPLIMISIMFVNAGAPLEVFSHLDSILGSIGRFRLDFGYYHVNGLGNLCLCSIVVSTIALYILKKIKVINVFFNIILSISIVVMDIISIIVLLSTASRTSILALVIFVLFLSYFVITNTNKINKRLRLTLKIIILVISIEVIMFVLLEQLSGLFVDSNRMKNIVINMPLLTENGRWLIGLGLFDPGLFGTSRTVYGDSYYVDNYYLCVLLETGIIGLIFVVYLLVMIGAKLFKSNNINKDLISYIITAMFISQLITGTGETGVISYLFPSSIIYFTIYFLHIDTSISTRLKIIG